MRIHVDEMPDDILGTGRHMLPDLYIKLWARAGLSAGGNFSTGMKNATSTYLIISPEDALNDLGVRRLSIRIKGMRTLAGAGSGFRAPERSSR